jgi:hypothetical protein
MFKLYGKAQTASAPDSGQRAALPGESWRSAFLSIIFDSSNYYLPFVCRKLDPQQFNRFFQGMPQPDEPSN